MIEGVQVYSEGPDTFFVIAPDYLKTKVKKTGQGYLLSFKETPSLRYTFLNENGEGLEFYYDGALRIEVIVKEVKLEDPELDAPVEQWSLDFCESDPWLCDRAFELFNLSAWGEVVAMGLMGRHSPMTDEQRQAMRDFTETGILILPEPRERTWYKGLSEDKKAWIKEEVSRQISNYGGDLQACVYGLGPTWDIECMAIERDNLESVLWLIGETCSDYLHSLDSLATTLYLDSQVEQLYRAGTDYPEMWWSLSYEDPFEEVL